MRCVENNSIGNTCGLAFRAFFGYCFYFCLLFWNKYFLGGFVPKVCVCWPSMKTLAIENIDHSLNLLEFSGIVRENTSTGSYNYHWN